jgi:hypothetical protein
MRTFYAVGRRLEEFGKVSTTTPCMRFEVNCFNVFRIQRRLRSLG